VVLTNPVPSVGPKLAVKSLRKITLLQTFRNPGFRANQLYNIFMPAFQFHKKTLMKKPYLVSAILLFFCFSVSAQDVIRQRSCQNELISKQVDSLKNLYSNDGFVLVREASMAMESEYEMPVVVPLNQGSWYQFVFIGEYSSRLYEVRMFDWNEKQVVYQKKLWGDIDGNVISYSYTPQFSEFHMMKPVQVNKQKKKNLCGYVMLFKKTANVQP
jgi:hypothetical protein